MERGNQFRVPVTIKKPYKKVILMVTGNPIIKFGLRQGKLRNLCVYFSWFFYRNGDFKPELFYETALTDDLRRSSSIIINRGATINFEDNQNFELKTDAIVQYICETDASKTFVYQDDKIKDIQEIIAQITPQSRPNPTPLNQGISIQKKNSLL
ncbi:MAG TPA: hypothetical protein PKY82_23480 [Pyrinomonadaceae bacterium]|nr:hypothetical protein [Pyrinomonadaceae bacterium]